MTPHRHAHRPHHVHTEHLPYTPGAQHAEERPSMLQRWIRRWRGPEAHTRRHLSEQRRLLAIRRLIIVDLRSHSASFTQRDLRLYACLIGATDLLAVHRLRFELIDLLCRQIGEGAATVRLHEIDAWLSPRA